MRVPTGSIGAQLTANLQAALGALARQQDRLSSGRRITAPSDDPAGFADVLTLRSRQAAIEQFGKNVSEAKSLLGTTEGAIRSAFQTITQAKEHALLGANETADAQARAGHGAAVDQLLENLVALANTKSGADTYLFGGQESKTPPYTVTRNGSGAITAVTVNPRGIDGKTLAEITEGVTAETSISGTTVFGAPSDTTYAFDVLIRLRDALNTNDVTTVRNTSIAQLDAAFDRLGAPLTVVGARLSWLGLVDEQLSGEALDQARVLSRVDDVDYAREVSDLQQLQAAYEAALASAARLAQLSLVNFLR